MKAVADNNNNINVTKNLKSAWATVENIVEKENAGFQYFFPFPTMFLKGFFFKVVKSRHSVVKS